jgi:Septum formation
MSGEKPGNTLKGSLSDRGFATGATMSEAPGTGTATKGLDPPEPSRAATPAAPRRRARRVMVILAALAGTLALAAAAVAGAAVIVTQRTTKAHVAAHSLRATVFRLRPGQCFDSLPNGIGGAHAVPCVQPHDAELYGRFLVAGRHWPGTAAVAERARQGCQSRLTGYLNPQLDTSGMAESYVYPNEGAWQAGVRSVICEIRGTQGRLTGSVRASRG